MKSTALAAISPCYPFWQSLTSPRSSRSTPLSPAAHGGSTYPYYMSTRAGSITPTAGASIQWTVSSLATAYFYGLYPVLVCVIGLFVIAACLRAFRGGS